MSTSEEMVTPAKIQATFSVARLLVFVGLINSGKVPDEDGELRKAICSKWKELRSFAPSFSIRIIEEAIATFRKQEEESEGWQLSLSDFVDS